MGCKPHCWFWLGFCCDYLYVFFYIMNNFDELKKILLTSPPPPSFPFLFLHLFFSFLFFNLVLSYIICGNHLQHKIFFFDCACDIVSQIWRWSCDYLSCDLPNPYPPSKESDPELVLLVP